MDFQPQIVAAGLLAVFLIAFSKGAFGGGLAVVGIPILSLVMDPVDAAVVLAPLLPLMDLATLKVFPPSTWSKPDVLWVVSGVVLGMGVGALVLAGLSGPLASGVIGAAILLYALRQLLATPRAAGPVLPVSPKQAMGWGALGGLTTFLANAGQPPVAAYLTRRDLSKTAFAGTMSGIFTIANLARLPLIAAIGLDRLHLLLYAAAMIPAIPLGTYVGNKLHDRLDRARLFRIVYVLLLVAGGKLLASATGILP